MNDDARLVVVPDAGAAAEAAATHIAGVLASAAAERGVVHWSTTGGSTPVGIYRALTIPPLVGEVPWNAVHVWWGDDRYVPRDHPLSNVAPADQILLRAGALGGQSGWGEDGEDVVLGIEPAARIPVANMHPIPMAEAIGEARGVPWAAARYDVELRAAGLPTQDGWPVFDLVLLGMGPDGHVMSVFPGSETFGRSEWALPVPAPTHVEPHVSRVTLNPAVLGVARSIVVVATGAAKADVLAAVFGERLDSRALPAQLARRPEATWFVDEAAAARLGDRVETRR
jgi:6-phosphogluconolactonase